MTQRVLVVGAGGLGGVTAARLYEAGVPVTVLVRPGLTADAVAQGIRVTDEDGPRRVAVPVATDLAAVGRADVIVLATQPQDVEAAADGVLPALAEHGVAVVLQNGLCEPRVARVMGAERTLGAVVAWGASVEAPGVVRRTSHGGMTLGRWDGRTDDPRLPRVAELLGVVAPTEVTGDLVGARWTKLAFNCAISTLGTLGGERVGPLVRRRVVRRLVLEVLTEAVAVAQAEQVALAPLSGTLELGSVVLTPDEQRGARTLHLVRSHALLLAVGIKIRHLRSSMLRALEAGRRPPVDFLNGEIVTRAAQHGLAVPVNAAARDLVHACADGRATPGLALLQQLYASTRASAVR